MRLTESMLKSLRTDKGQEDIFHGPALFKTDAARKILESLTSEEMSFAKQGIGAERYSRWNEGWEPVMDRFPAAIDDIEEASKTLALHRATACVFHLMRVMEVGLKAVSRALGIPYAPSWESYLRQIKANVDKDWKDKDAEWRAREPFFRDALALLFAVKVAWRNPTMHIVSHYTSEQAEDILNAVRGFMRHISTELAFDPEIPA